MVLVVTGQLVSSFDEEFRRLYARSTVPIVQAIDRSSQYLRDPISLQSPMFSQFSLHQLHMRSRGMLGMRSAQEDRFHNPSMLPKGLSVQERLHQSHCADLGNLYRGNSYGGELQKLNSLSRLRMGTKDLAVPLFTPEKAGANQGGVSELLLSNRLSQQQLRHRTRYGADQNLIPFNSESSLHRWKMDTYLNNSDTALDASSDLISPVASPFSSHTGLNELQLQMIHGRSRDIKTRMEEMRQKRLSLQDYSNLRQSQGSLRYPTERPSFMSSLRGLDTSVAELESNSLTNSSLELANHEDNEKHREGILTDGHRSASYYDVKTVSNRKQMQTYDWNEPLSRTTSAGNLDIKIKDSPVRSSYLQPGGQSVQLPKAMKSLSEIPEEKEGSNPVVNSSDIAAKEREMEELSEEDGAVQNENLLADPQQVQASGSRGPTGRVEGHKSVSKDAQNVSPGSQRVEEASSCLEKGQMQNEEPSFQRKNSLKMKVYALLTSDEKKVLKKEDKPFQRKASLKSKNTSGLSQPVKADHSQVYSADRVTKKGQSPGVSRLQNPNRFPSETEKQKSTFHKLSPQRSSKRKTNHSADQDRGSSGTLDNEDTTVYQRQKVYSRYEYLLTTENVSKDRSSSLNWRDSGYPTYPTQSGSDKKLGKFMQRVGNLIGKK